MSPTRRDALRLTGCAVTAALSGCQVPLLSDQHRVDLRLFNYTADPQQVKIEFLRTDRQEYNDANVFSREYEVPSPPEDESAGTLMDEDIVDRRPYILRAQPHYGNGQWHHYHYFPGESTSGPEHAYVAVRLYRRENGDAVYPRFL